MNVAQAQETFLPELFILIHPIGPYAPDLVTFARHPPSNG
jgi:hypothetical protein